MCWSIYVVICRRHPRFGPCPFPCFITVPGHDCKGLVEVFCPWFWWERTSEVCRIVCSWPVQQRNVCTLQKVLADLALLVPFKKLAHFNHPKPSKTIPSRSGVHPPMVHDRSRSRVDQVLCYGKENKKKGLRHQVLQENQESQLLPGEPYCRQICPTLDIQP